MQLIANTLLAAAAVAAVAAVPAIARDSRIHVMTVALPDGNVARIEYVGDIAPQVTMAPAPVIAWQDPFAALERMSAALDQQMDTMMRQVAMPLAGGGVTVMTSYSSDGACTRTTQVTYTGGDAAPRTVSYDQGDCADAPRPALPAAVPARHRPHAAPATILARADRQTSDTPLLHEAVWQR